jgi:nucleotide-binding universal stress UspA family protein
MPYPSEPPVLIDPDPKEVAERHRRALEEQLTPFRDEYPDVEVVDELVREAPAHARLRASDRADLLVVGSRGCGGFHGLAHGSVSHAILHYSACPVAVCAPTRPRHEEYPRTPCDATYCEGLVLVD